MRNETAALENMIVRPLRTAYYTVSRNVPSAVHLCFQLIARTS